MWRTRSGGYGIQTFRQVNASAVGQKLPGQSASERQELSGFPDAHLDQLHAVGCSLAEWHAPEVPAAQQVAGGPAQHDAPAGQQIGAAPGTGIPARREESRVTARRSR